MWHELARTKRFYGPSSKEIYGNSQVTSAAGKRPNKFDRRFEHSGTGTFNERRLATEAITNFMNMFAGQANQSRPWYQNQSRSYSNKSQPNRPTSSEGKKPLQITSGNPAATDPRREGSYPAKDDCSNGRKYSKEKKAYVVDEDEEEETGNEPPGYYQENENDNINYFDPDQYDEPGSAEEEVSANIVTIPTATPYCRRCGKSFNFNNKLHRHLRQNCSEPAQAYEATASIPVRATLDISEPKPIRAMVSSFVSTSSAKQIPVIKSTVDAAKTLGTGYGFRGFQYATASYVLHEDGTPTSGCLDTGCGISLHDINSFKEQTQGKIPIRKMVTPITVRGIGSNKHATDEYAIVDIRLQGLKDGKPAITLIRREVHLVEDLKANFLIGNNILKPEGFKIDLERNKAFISSCGVTIPINVQSRSIPIHKPIHLKKSTVIPPHSITPVQVHSLAAMPSDRDFLFEPDDVNFSLYAHIVNFETEAILVRNDEPKAITIPRNLRLGYATELEYSNAFFAGETFDAEKSDTKGTAIGNTHNETDIGDLARRCPKFEHKKSWFKKVLAACTAIAAVGISLAKPSPLNMALSHTGMEETAFVATPAAEIVLPIGVKIYDSGMEAVNAFTKIVDEYTTMWTDQGFAALPEEHWMRIPLKSD